MAYATKYNFTFNSLHSGLAVLVEIQQDGYVGSAQAIQGVGKSPCILSRQGNNEALLAAIRATECQLTVRGVDPTEFISANDTEWRIKVSYNGSPIYYGFISQEDTTEPVEFVQTAVQIRATDGLALLKNVPFIDTLYGTFTADSSLYNIILYCVNATGLTLPINIFANLWANGMNEGAGFAWANQVYTRLYYFEQSEDNYKDCFTILNEVLTSMCARLYQCNGEWVIDRPAEFERFPSGVPGSRFVWTSGVLPDTVADVTLNTTYNSLIPVRRTQLKTTYRPAKTVTRPFVYERPTLLRNANFSKLGALLGTITEGPNTVSRYALIDWQVQNSGVGEIRVVRDTVLNVELERYLYLTFIANDPQFGTVAAITSNDTPIEEFDEIEVSFEFQGDANSSQPDRFSFAAALITSSNIVFRLNFALQGNPNDSRMLWVSTGAPPFNDMRSSLSVTRSGNQDSTEEYNVSFADFNVNNPGQPIPQLPANSRLFKLYLMGFNNTSSSIADLNAKIKNVQFNYTFLVNKSLAITGQTHQTGITTDFKNIIEAPMHIDDSPKLLAKGTLYVVIGSPGVNTKTYLWSATKGGTKNKTFGQINTEDLHRLESVNRVQLEGEFIGLPIAPGIFTFDFEPGKKFVETTLNIDLAAGECSGVFREVVGDTLPSITYQFNYQYG